MYAYITKLMLFIHLYNYTISIVNLKEYIYEIYTCSKLNTYE